MDLQDPVSSFMVMTGVVMMLALVFTVITLAGALLARDWLGPSAFRDVAFAGHGALDEEFSGIDLIDHAATAEAAVVSNSERREHKRFRTYFLGTLHSDAEALANSLCDVVDMSATGARIRPVEPVPAMMSDVTIGLERLGRLPARVVWRRDGEVGLRFDWEPDDVMAKLRGMLPMPTLVDQHVH